MALIVRITWEPNLWNSGDIKEQCRPTDQVHDADLANQVLQMAQTNSFNRHIEFL